MSGLTLLSSEHAWGYWSADSLLSGVAEEQLGISFRYVIYFQNVANAISILYSPIVGLVRAVVAIWLVIKISCLEDSGTTKFDAVSARRYGWTMLGRAALEMLGLGAVIGLVVDPIITLRSQKLLCFAAE